METEKENNLFFLVFEIIREQDKFATTVYQKSSFNGVYSNFQSYFSLKMFSYFLKLNMIPYKINFSERNISQEWLP